MSIIIVAADFHKDLAEKMIQAAKSELKNQGRDFRLIKVAGCYEMPLVVDKVMAAKGTEAVVALGFIEKGQTMHGEVMGHVVHKSLVDLQLKYGKPVGFGIIGPGATLEQAQVRAQEYAKRAVIALLQNISVLEDEI